MCCGSNKVLRRMLPGNRVVPPSRKVGKHLERIVRIRSVGPGTVFAFWGGMPFFTRFFDVSVVRTLVSAIALFMLAVPVQLSAASAGRAKRGEAKRIPNLDPSRSTIHAIIWTRGSRFSVPKGKGFKLVRPMLDRQGHVVVLKNGKGSQKVGGTVKLLSIQHRGENGFIATTARAKKLGSKKPGKGGWQARNIRVMTKNETFNHSEQPVNINFNSDKGEVSILLQGSEEGLILKSGLGGYEPTKGLEFESEEGFLPPDSWAPEVADKLKIFVHMWIEAGLDR